jgi:hypothetical protein
VSRPKLEELTLRSEISLSLGDFSAARSLAAEVRALIASSPNRPWLALWEARAALAEGKATLQGGNAHEALPPLERALALRSGLLDAESPAIAEGEIALSNCYLELHERKKASALLVRAEAIHRQHATLGAHFRIPLNELKRRFRLAGAY